MPVRVVAGRNSAMAPFDFFASSAYPGSLEEMNAAGQGPASA